MMLDKEYRELSNPDEFGAYYGQRLRKHEMEQLPAYDWETKRKTLIESGLVADRAAANGPLELLKVS